METGPAMEMAAGLVGGSVLYGNIRSSTGKDSSLWQAITHR